MEIQISESFKKKLGELFTHEFISDLITTAIYGSTWLDITYPEKFREDAERFLEFECYEDKTAYALLHGYAIEYRDYEDGDDDAPTLILVDLNKFIEGFLTFMLECPQSYANVMDENYDICDAEALMQCVMFGEVVYG